MAVETGDQLMEVREPLPYSFYCIIMIKMDAEMLTTEAGRQTET
jgi:hypothetical protein